MNSITGQGAKKGPEDGPKDGPKDGPENGIALVIQSLPILVGVLLLSVESLQADQGQSWDVFAAIMGIEFLAALPLLLAHLACYRLPLAPASFLWVATFALYPFIMPLTGIDKTHISLFGWCLMAALSGLGLLFGPRERAGFGILKHIPVTLDAAVALLLTLWAIGASLLFISTPDPVNNQPLSVWFNGPRILAHPGLFFGYLAQFAFAAGLVFAFYWVCRYILVRRISRQFGWTLFLLASAAFWTIVTPAFSTLVLLLPLNEPHWAILPSEVPNPFHRTNYFFTFILWAIICPIVMASERLLDQAGEAETRHDQIQAELKQLQSQINPHFLFNTLNTLYALCLRDNQASAQAVVKLSDLLRYSVYESQGTWVPLDKEIEHLTNYLDLQMLRFGTRCELSTRWPDNSGEFQIPPQMLILLVENAFKHGIEPSEQISSLSLEMTIDGEEMTFCCTNSPIAPDLARGEDGETAGLGLANLERRLQLQFGSKYSLQSGADNDSWIALLKLGLQPC